MKLRNIHILLAALVVTVSALAAMGFQSILGPGVLAGANPAYRQSAAPLLSSEAAAETGGVASPVLVAEARPREATKEPVRKQAPAPPLRPEYPSRLLIPNIEVQAPVQTVGLTKTGNIAAPSSFSATGWYVKSALPGEPGSMIVSGHVDNGLLRLGVFKHLHYVHEGDEMFVETRGGKKFRYVVSRVASYPYQEVPMAVILSQKEQSELVLITCGGEWLKEEKTYTQRLVVYATLAE